MTDLPFDLSEEDLDAYRSEARERTDVGDKILIFNNVFIQRTGDGPNDFRVVAEDPSDVHRVEQTHQLYEYLFVDATPA